MGSDRARVSYDPRQQYRSVVMQQGRVTLEADFNEELAIAGEELRKETLDVVGPCGTPDNGYLITPLAKPAFDFSIGPGAMYVGGLRATTPEPMPGPGPLQYSNQQEWLDHTDDPDWVDIPAQGFAATNEFVYLFLREQEVSAVEDSDLKDVALGGPDTAQRTRLIQHVVRLADGSTCAAGLAAAQTTWTGKGLKFNTSTMRLQSVATLQVGFSPTGPPPDPCNPQALGGYLGADNQLIRVQISDTDKGNLKFVWGFDDASFLYRLDLDPNNKQLLHLQSRPVDASHQPQAKQAIEVLRSAAELSNGEYIASLSGCVLTLDQPYNPDTQIITLPAPLTKLPDEFYDPSQTPRAFLRVWEQELIFTPGTAVSLGNTGLQVTLQTEGKVFHTGDYWLFAVRPSTPQQIYPEHYLTTPQPPGGPRMWACPLGVITWTGQKGVLTEDCRNFFDNLVDLTKRKPGTGGCCTVSVTPQLLAGNNTLQSVVDSLVKPALVLSAADAGSPGNDIAFEVANVRPDQDRLKTQLAVELLDTHTYQGLTTATIASMLAASVGLVHVSGSVNAGLALQPTTLALQGGSPNTKATAVLKDVQGNVITLEAKKAGAAGNNITVTIANVSGLNFDLAVRYFVAVPSITLNDLGQNNNPDLAFDVIVSPPSGGFSTPIAGITRLSGGTDGPPTQKAGATFFALTQATICLAPGAYFLPKTLKLGVQHSGLTIEACGGDAVLQAAAGAADFLQGLILLNSAQNVTLSGLTLNLPAISFGNAAFAGLTPEQLSVTYRINLTPFFAGIGIRALQCSDLSVAGCSFFFQQQLDNIFEAGIFLGGSTSGLNIANNRFSHGGDVTPLIGNSFAMRVGCIAAPIDTIIPPFIPDAIFRPAGVALETLTISPSLVTSPAVSPTITAADVTPPPRTVEGTVFPAVVQDAAFLDNRFEGLAAAVLSLAATETVRLEGNSIDNCYAGLWFISLAAIAAGQNVPILALAADPVVSIGGTIARGYPLPGDFQPLSFETIALSPQPPSGGILNQFSQLYNDLLELEAAVLSNQLASGGLLLQASRNQIRTIAGNLSASGLVIWCVPPGSAPNNVILSANTVHSNTNNVLLKISPGGLPTVVVMFAAPTVITGNLIINEGPSNSFATALFMTGAHSQDGDQAPLDGIAVIGNIIQRRLEISPSSNRPTFNPPAAAPYNTWDFLNTVIP